MSICTFFGHRECYGLDAAVLQNAIEDLIHQGVDSFMVGHQGRFDRMVRRCLKLLQAQYPHIQYCVVLAYLPTQKMENDNLSDTIYPEGLEYCPPKFAIDRRNRYMLEQCEWVICYIRRTWGGAYKFVEKAKRMGKKIVAL